MLGSLQWFLVEEQLGFLAPLLAFFSGRHQEVDEAQLAST